MSDRDMEFLDQDDGRTTIVVAGGGVAYKFRKGSSKANVRLSAQDVEFEAGAEVLRALEEVLLEVVPSLTMVGLLEDIGSSMDEVLENPGLAQAKLEAHLQMKGEPIPTSA